MLNSTRIFTVADVNLKQTNVITKIELCYYENGQIQLRKILQIEENISATKYVINLQIFPKLTTIENISLKELLKYKFDRKSLIYCLK